MALKLTVRSHKFSCIRKRRQVTCLPTGSAPAASRRRSHEGVSRQALRSLSWNGGHLGQRRWARLAAMTQTDAPDICDVVAARKAASALYVSRWCCVSLASPEPQPGARSPKPTCTAQTTQQGHEAPTQLRRKEMTQSRIWCACCAKGGGLRLRPAQLCSLLSCYRRGQAVLGVTAHVT